MKITRNTVLTADAFTPIKMEPNLTLALSAGPYQLPGINMTDTKFWDGDIEY